MQIKWTSSAEKDLENIEEYIAKDNPVAAIEQVLIVIGLVAELLPTFPEIGRDGRTHKTRELVIVGTKYIAVYQIRGNTIYILRVVHGSQRWPIPRI